MDCPYCRTKIAHDALACPHCTRDVALVNTLLARIQALEARLVTPAATRADSASPAGPRAVPVRAALIFTLIPVVLLNVAVYVFTVLDAVPNSNVWLFVTSLLIPFPFGFVAGLRHDYRTGSWILVAMAMALVAVASMSTVVHVSQSLAGEDVGFLRTRRDWTEAFQFWISIGASNVSGFLLGSMAARSMRTTTHASGRGGLSRQIVTWVLGSRYEQRHVEHAVARLQDIGRLLAAMGTTFVSVYAGYQKVFGG